MGKKTTLSPCGIFCLLLIFPSPSWHKSRSGESRKNCKELCHFNSMKIKKNFLLFFILFYLAWFPPTLAQTEGGIRLFQSGECKQLLCFWESGHVWHFYPLLIIIKDFTKAASAFESKSAAKSVLMYAYIWPVYQRNMNSIHLFNHKEPGNPVNMKTIHFHVTECVIFCSQ